MHFHEIHCTFDFLSIVNTDYAKMTRKLRIAHILSERWPSCLKSHTQWSFLCFAALRRMSPRVGRRAFRSPCSSMPFCRSASLAPLSEQVSGCISCPTPERFTRVWEVVLVRALAVGGAASLNQRDGLHARYLTTSVYRVQAWF